MTKSTCNNCKSEGKIVTDNESGEIVCTGCGYIQEITELSEQLTDKNYSEIKTESEGTYEETGDSEFNPELEGTNVKSSQSELGESIVGGRKLSSFYKDAKGKKITASVKNSMKRLDVQEKYARTKFQNSLQDNEELRQRMLNLIPGEINGPYKPLKETFNLNYNKVIRKKLQKGRSASLMALATLIISFKMHGYPFTWKEIKNSLDSGENTSRWGKQNKLFDYYGLLVKEFEIDTRYFLNNESQKYDIIDILQKLDKIDESQYGKISKKLSDILTNAEKTALTGGKKLGTVLASALYISCLQEKIEIELSDVAKAANVTEQMIRKFSRELNVGLKLNLTEL